VENTIHAKGSFASFNEFFKAHSNTLPTKKKKGTVKLVEKIWGYIDLTIVKTI
jgi:hypothetical protein